MFWKHPYCSQPLQVFSHWSHLAFSWHHLSHGHHLWYGITSRTGHFSYGIIFRTASPLARPSPFVRHHLLHGHHLLYGMTSCTASSFVRHHLSHGHHLSYGITSCVRHHLSHGHHLLYGITSCTASSFVRHHIFRTASPLAWPSPFVRHHVSHGSPLVWHHFSHGIIFCMAITSRTAITSLIRHHISHGHRTASPLANIGITLAIVPTVAGWAGGELSWTARQFKNTLDKFRILKKISTTKLLLLVRLLPGFSTNLS